MELDWLDWLNARDYVVAREILQRGVAALAVIAFVSTLNQFRPLLGEHGLLPVPALLRAAGGRLRGPSVFRWWRYTDRRLTVVCWVGIVLGASVVGGLPQLAPPFVPLLVFLVLWLLYLSIVVVGQTFYGFGWEMLLCEALFTVAFLGSVHEPPPLTVLIAVWWLVFRLEFGAGMIKVRGGREWRDLTALMYHHETQPMPGPLSRQAHLLPPWFHRLEVVGNHVAQLVVPFLLFVPAIGGVPVGSIAAAVIILTQLWLVATGNFAWLNWITVVLAAGAISDSAWWAVIPGLSAAADPLASSAEAAGIPVWWAVVVVAASVLFAWLAVAPIRNLFSKRQLMNASFNRFLLGNAYGAFGTVTKRRIEIVVEGTAAADPGDPDVTWLEYAFKGKPGDVRRMPGQFAPYHLRLDWLMWFLPLGRMWEPWFEAFLVRLLEADAPTLRLLAGDPFAGERPTWVRARAYRYRFTTRAEFRETGDRWVRELEGEVVGPASLRDT
ncbi:lipase maturation factor family protein [Agromyces sp. CFH 90414]|uniref:Lipase maturation factor family protein n=1 Tax=Agromyces agglutinans TaxID=2662258 RepID=A0A6I2F998_9MICO|nr:lipase maturation factor family protein [Agromyces agglutinans]MRG61209.1 lipase maturation factor family protein [Agromyces agglutinans]